MARAKNYSRPLVVHPDNYVNPARNSGNDIWSTPFVPVHHSQWAFLGVQLSNGWQNTNYGLRQAYVNYLNLLTASGVGPGRPTVLPGQGQSPTGHSAPSQSQISRVMKSSSRTSKNSSTGDLGPGVTLAGRRFYG